MISEFQAFNEEHHGWAIYFGILALIYCLLALERLARGYWGTAAAVLACPVAVIYIAQIFLPLNDILFLIPIHPYYAIGLSLLLTGIVSALSEYKSRREVVFLDTFETPKKPSTTKK